MQTYLMAYLGAVAVSLVATPATIRLARAVKALDLPGLRKVHRTPTPRIGGVAVAAATIFVVMPILLLDNTVGQALRQKLPQIVGLLAAAAFMLAVGLVDDVRGLRARTKLLSQLLAAIALCAVGVRIDVLSAEGLFHVQLGWLSWPLTCLWVIGITNALNLIDGLDGLAAGISAVACAVIAAFTVCTGQLTMTVLMLAMLGALTGFLFFGFNPAKVFLGDCGSLFLGFMLAGTSVLSSAKAPTIVGLALPVLAMGVPIFDTLFSMVRRVLERRSLFAPDRGHIHHRLLAMGLRQRHVVLLLYAVTVLSAGLGMFLMVTRHVGTLLVFLCVLTLLVLVFRVVGVIGLRDALRRAQRNLGIARRHRHIQEDFETAELLLREVRSFEQWWDALCRGAEMLGITRVLLSMFRADGTPEYLLWQGEECRAEAPAPLRMRLPCGGPGLARSPFADIEVPTDGSLELAGRRAEMFGRLMEEHGPAGPWAGPAGLTWQAEGLTAASKAA
ncbi:MAG TPA: MraY family glycosyltransferase [Phycisphaerae bacterium]|nr:MraY family glycosyltransferase [Phycisphaerae bacterium]HUT58561.1 MraY family glycosyltransferase [Phycisphaerae bacterium]